MTEDQRLRKAREIVEDWWDTTDGALINLINRVAAALPREVSDEEIDENAALHDTGKDQAFYWRLGARWMRDKMKGE